MRLLKKTKMRIMAFAIAFAMVLALPVVPGVKAEGEEVVFSIEPLLYEPGESVVFVPVLEWPEGYDDDEGLPECTSADFVFEPAGEEYISFLESMGIYVDDARIEYDGDDEIGPGQAAYISNEARPGNYCLGTYTYVGDKYSCDTPVQQAEFIVIASEDEENWEVVYQWPKADDERSKQYKMQFVLYAEGLDPTQVIFEPENMLSGATGTAIRSALAGKGDIICAYEYDIKGEGNEEDENDFEKDMSGVSMELGGDYTGITWYKLDPDSGYAISEEYTMTKNDGRWEGGLGGLGTYAVVGTKGAQPEKPEYESSRMTITVTGEGDVTVTDKKTGKVIEGKDSVYENLDPKGEYLIETYPGEGYEFSRWSIHTGFDIKYDANKPELTVTKLAEEVKLNAVFREEVQHEDPNPVIEDPKSEIKATAGEGGSVVIDDGVNPLEGDARKGLDPQGPYYLTAEPDEAAGYEFLEWVWVEGDYETSTELTEPMLEIMNLGEFVSFHAVFKQKDKEYYSLTIPEVEGGSFELKDSKNNAYLGNQINVIDPEEEYTLTAIADEENGYHFVKWNPVKGIETEDSLDSDTIKFRVTEDEAEISMELEKDPDPVSRLDIVSNPEDGGSVEVYDGEDNLVSEYDLDEVNSKDTYRLVAMAEDDYEFVAWSVDGAFLIDSEATDEEIVIGNLQPDVSVIAVFEKILKDITDAKVTLAKKTYVYTGSEITPDVTVVLDGTTLKKGTDYDVKYDNNVKAGKATVTVIAKGDYKGSAVTTFEIKNAVLKYRAYVQKKSWKTGWQTAKISGSEASKMAGTTDNLRMETIQMQLSGVGGAVEYRAYCQKKGWVGVGTSTGGWATTAKTTTNAGTKGESRRVEMIQLRMKGEIATLYDIYYRTYCEKFGWLGWAKNLEKAGSAGYARKLEAFQVNLVPKGEKVTLTSDRVKSFYDVSKDGKNPK